MSTVDKMLIKGIRSFDPENKNVVTFFRPLTLIVGPNGAGKTTIIECLKVACTGELPPNARSGHSFVHDPKVAGETETKGQIKLRFKTAAGKDVVCIRSFQLTQKATKMEYKAIESVLQTINPHTGEKVCLSYRCADMDREIPALMGVSKAILENVIFAHQDEANWPLQDPSTLKKKFDDIFSATRYTKALEVIKKLHKDQSQEIKSFKLKLENLQMLKDAAYKLRECIAQDQKETNKLKNEIQVFEGEVQDLDSKIDCVKGTLEDLRKLQEQITAKTAERSALYQEKQRKKAALDSKSEDTDEDLQEWKAKFDEKIALLESKISKLRRETDDLLSKRSFLQMDIKGYTGEILKLENEAHTHRAYKNQRDTSIKELFERYNVGPVSTSQFSDEIALNLMNRLRSRLADYQKDLEGKKKSNSVIAASVWSQYENAHSRWNDMSAKINAKVDTKKDFLKRIEEKKNLLYKLELEISDVNLAHLDEREQKLQADCEKKNNQIEERGFGKCIMLKQSEIYTLAPKINDLKHERDRISADSEDRVKLSIKKVELETKKKKHKKILDEYKDKIKVVMKGRLPQDKDLKKEVTQVQRTMHTEFEDLSAKASEAEKDLNMVQMKIEEANNNLYKINKEAESKKRYVESKLQLIDPVATSIDIYLKLWNSVKEKSETLKSKHYHEGGMQSMFGSFENYARNHHICPCCERLFSAEEEDDFVKKQRVKGANTAEHLNQLAMESSRADSQFQQLDNLNVTYKEYIKIREESIPILEKKLSELNTELETKNQALDDVLCVMAQIKEDKGLVDALSQPVENAERLLLEIQVLEREVDDLEYKLDSRGQGVKSIEEIQSELNALETKRESLHNEVEKLREEQRYMENDRNSAQFRLAAIREEKVKSASALQSVETVQNELEQLVEEKSQVELDEKHLREALGPLSKEKDKLHDEYNDLKSKVDNEHYKQSKVCSNFELEIKALDVVITKIEDYYTQKKGERLKELREKQNLSESQLQNCESRLQEISEELTKSNELMMNQDPLRRNIEDNLNYRKTKADVSRLGGEIELLENEVKNLGGFSKVQAENARLLQERESLLSKLNKCHGTLSVYVRNLSKYENDLKQAQYKDIDNRYFDQMIQLKTTEMANKDLDRYYNALDKALMRFHTMKMEEINKIIRELWQQTYRGQDIDYIRIHSDSEVSGTRSYSYKLLMQTGETELEMRGRCSAGQKVLASLIIRLALAETFCLHCGILALDEPTTNLDGPNSESLAAALVRIMEDRKGQENFQLIVITHDERFAQLIGQRQHAEKYYRITKDDQQHSIIEAQAIFE
ncbi:unnamed protein product [Cuscuta campestris]|uniref:DNA repair protein RAD50 n=1 Tax=Cuscuta campestris TaxID=132261 RepID=A0A484LGC9_9ASTE|nr:unnamed protein product [Cuscuta campestris]